MQILYQTLRHISQTNANKVLLKFSIKQLLFKKWYVNFVEIVLNFVNE